MPETIAFYGLTALAETGLAIDTAATFASTAAVTGAATAVSGATSVYQTVEQGKAEERRYQAQNRIAQVRAQREREEQVRAMRIQKAKNIAAGVVAGGDLEGSSGFIGSQASLQSNLTRNLTFARNIENLTGDVAREDINIYKSGQKKQIAGSVGKVSGTIFDDLDGWQKLFS